MSDQKSMRSVWVCSLSIVNYWVCKSPTSDGPKGKTALHTATMRLHEGMSYYYILFVLYIILSQCYIVCSNQYNFRSIIFNVCTYIQTCTQTRTNINFKPPPPRLDHLVRCVSSHIV